VIKLVFTWTNIGGERSLWPRDRQSLQPLPREINVDGWSREKRGRSSSPSPLDISEARNYATFLLPARGDGRFTFVAIPQTADFRRSAPAHE